MARIKQFAMKIQIQNEKAKRTYLSSQLSLFECGKVVHR